MLLLMGVDIGVKAASFKLRLPIEIDDTYNTEY
jgi:hypothetical protein